MMFVSWRLLLDDSDEVVSDSKNVVIHMTLDVKSEPVGNTVMTRVRGVL